MSNLSWCTCAPLIASSALYRALVWVPSCSCLSAAAALRQELKPPTDIAQREDADGQTKALDDSGAADASALMPPSKGGYLSEGLRSPSCGACKTVCVDVTSSDPSSIRQLSLFLYPSRGSSSVSSARKLDTEWLRVLKLVVSVRSGMCVCVCANQRKRASRHTQHARGWFRGLEIFCVVDFRGASIDQLSDARL